MEMMHKIPTSILHSLEGMPGVDWHKMLRLQSSDGSFHSGASWLSVRCPPFFFHFGKLVSHQVHSVFAAKDMLPLWISRLRRVANKPCQIQHSDSKTDGGTM